MTPRCETCRWWEELPSDEQGPGYGLCLYWTDGDGANGAIKHKNNFCGEHAPREEKSNG